MAIERQAMHHEEEQRESEDETLLDRRQAQADVIQFQRDYKSQHPRMVEGPFIHDETLWHFRASNSVATTHLDPNWFHYKPIPHSEYSPMMNLTTVTDEARERFARAFPYEKESTVETSVYPEFEEFAEELEAAIKLAFERRDK